jgi:hypothetical protein
MFLAQLAAFLMEHHHIHWISLLINGPLNDRTYLRIITWAAKHGFMYQR